MSTVRIVSAFGGMDSLHWLVRCALDFLPDHLPRGERNYERMWLEENRLGNDLWNEALWAAVGRCYTAHRSDLAPTHSAVPHTACAVGEDAAHKAPMHLCTQHLVAEAAPVSGS